MTHFFTLAAFMIDENIEHVFQYMKCSIAYGAYVLDGGCV